MVGSSERERALAILAERVPLTADLVQRIRQTLAQAFEGQFSRELMDALGRAGSAAKGAVPEMVRCLQDAADEPDARYKPGARQSGQCRSAAVALGRIGPDAAAAVPALTALRDKGDETIRVPAAQALRRIRAKK